MTSSERANEIARKYLENLGIQINEISKVIDKMYKSIAKIITSEGRCIIEVSKSEGSILQFE